jgi:ABC-type multidrug transport system fused ATPase/permease subunit
MFSSSSAGIACFICILTYMYIWVYTGEVGSKRLREQYLRALLRQDLVFFDSVGAGEVATRVQTDTREYAFRYDLQITYLIDCCRSCPARYFRENGPMCKCYVSSLRGIRFGVYSVLATCSGNFHRFALHGNNGRGHEQIRV